MHMWPCSRTQAGKTSLVLLVLFLPSPGVVSSFSPPVPFLKRRHLEVETLPPRRALAVARFEEDLPEIPSRTVASHWLEKPQGRKKEKHVSKWEIGPLKNGLVPCF